VKKILFSSLKILVSLAGLGFIVLLFRNRWQEVLEVLKSFHPGMFLLSIGIFLIGFAVITLRFQLILGVQKVHLSWWQLFYLNCVGHFFSLFLPSSVGGDVVKGYYTYKRSGEKVASFTSIFLDRFVGSLAVLSFGLMALFYYGKKLNLISLRNWVLLLFALMVCFIVLLLNKGIANRFRFFSFLIPSRKLKDLFSHAYHSLNYYKHHKDILVKVYLLSLIGQVFFISLYYALALSLDLHIPYLNFFLVIPIIAVLSLAPSINGLGVREAGFVYLMGRFTGSEQALALSLIYDGLVYGIGILFGVWYLFREGFRYGVVHEAMKLEDEFEKIETI